MSFKGEPFWQPAIRYRRYEIPAEIMDWLLDPTSLTRRLIDTCQQRHAGRFCVKVISQGYDVPMGNEAQRLQVPARQHGFIRQVRLLCNSTPWVFARTVIPVSTLVGRLRCLTRLGNRPLGAFLFADPGMRRGPMEIARLQAGQAAYNAVVSNLAQRPPEIWGRRSVFYLDDKPLLVSEIFLPGVTA
jgi:chorismate--pyruvate lyase